jgi:hypothetical protein
MRPHPRDPRSAKARARVIARVRKPTPPAGPMTVLFVLMALIMALMTLTSGLGSPFAG